MEKIIEHWQVREGKKGFNVYNKDNRPKKNISFKNIEEAEAYAEMLNLWGYNWKNPDELESKKVEHEKIKMLYGI
jgi:hypothetical protein